VMSAAALPLSTSLPFTKAWISFFE